MYNIYNTGGRAIAYKQNSNWWALLTIFFLWKIFCFSYRWAQHTSSSNWWGSLSTQETRRRSLRYSVYLLYWYKSTSTDTGGAARMCEHATFFCQFCFSFRWAQLYWYKSTSTDAGGAARICEHATAWCTECLTCQIWRYSVYLLYWYKHLSICEHATAL